jgi:hypothetical protein
MKNITWGPNDGCRRLGPCLGVLSDGGNTGVDGVVVLEGGRASVVDVDVAWEW